MSAILRFVCGALASLVVLGVCMGAISAAAWIADHFWPGDSGAVVVMLVAAFAVIIGGFRAIQD